MLRQAPDSVELKRNCRQHSASRTEAKEAKCLVAQLCATRGDPMDCSPPGFSVHGILQARILEWVAIPFSRGSS